MTQFRNVGDVMWAREITSSSIYIKKLVGQQMGNTEEVAFAKVLNHADVFPPKGVSHLENSSHRPLPL